VVALAVLVATGMALLWPDRADFPDVSELGFAAAVVRAEVSEVVEGACSFAEDFQCQRVTFRLLEGPDAGTITFEEWQLIPSTPAFAAGDRVVLNVVPDAPSLQRYQYADRERRGLLLVITALFALAVILLARGKGVSSLIGLGASIWLVLVFIVPAVLVGRSPELVAIVGGSGIALLALYLAHGWRPLTHVATIGTFGALALTVLLSAITTRLAAFTGITSDEAGFILFLDTVDIRGLMLAGMVLGALGALDDVTVTQASAVWELHGANPTLGRQGLFRAGLRVGRDHIASSVNTLLLAYAGAALPLLLLFALSGLPLGVVANSEVVAVEIVRTMVGSIGLVAAVPLTTWLATAVVRPRASSPGGPPPSTAGADDSAP
jgi:uncharacterized membrane protein